MLRRFARDGAIYGAAAILSRSVSFVLVPLFTRALAPGEYGMVDVLTVLASLVNLTVALEISQGLARHYPEAGSDEARLSYASTALWFTIAAFALFWLVAAASADALGRVAFGTAAPTPLMQAAIASMVANGVFYLAQNQLRWQLRPAAYAGSSLVVAAVTLAASVLLVVQLRLGVLGVVIALLAGNAAGAVAALYLARASYQLTFSWTRCREMLGFSLPLVPSSIAVFVALYADRIAIRELMTLADVGLFGVGYRVASVAGLLIVGFQGALTPLIYASHREAATPAALARIFRYFTAAGVLVCAALASFAPEVIALFTPARYSGAAVVVPFMAPAVLLASMYIFAPGLAIAKRTGTAALVNGAGAALNTALNFALIPLLGIRGAALATFVSAAAVFALYMAYSQRLYPVPHGWRQLAAAAAAAALVIAGAGAVRLPPVAALTAKVFLLTGLALLLVEFGLIDPGEVRRAAAAVRGKLTALFARPTARA